EVWRAALAAPRPEGKGPKEFARATPVTDGKSVYASLADGTVAAFSLEGKRLWTAQVDPPGLSYGPSASPVLAGGPLLVDGKRLQAPEASSGRSLWIAKDAEPHYGTPALLKLNGSLFAVTPKGAVVRVSDGAVLATSLAEGLGGDQSPTPVVRGDVVYFAYHRCSAVQLALKDGKIVSK